MSADSSVTDSPVGGVPLKMQMSGGNDPYTNTYNSTFGILLKRSKEKNGRLVYM